ncbi:MAG: tyrosine-type recombinase/integrase [Chloroflexota bacterium]
MGTRRRAADEGDGVGAGAAGGERGATPRPGRPGRTPGARRQGGRGEGTVYFHVRRQVWQGQVTVGKKPSKRDSARLVPDVLTVTAPTEAEAWARLEAVRRERGAGTLPSSRARAETMAALLERWLAATAGTVEPESHRRQRDAVRRRLIPALGQLRPAALRPDDVRALYARLRGSGPGQVSANTLRKTHYVLKAALQQAVDDGDLPTNVAARVTPPKLVPTEQLALERAEVQRLEVACAPKPGEHGEHGERLGALWLLAIYTGARAGELLGCTWADLQLEDPLAGRWTVRRVLALDETKRPIVTPRAKRRSSLRTLPLPPLVAAALRAHRARQAEERLRAGQHWQPHDLVFCTELGTPYPPSNLLNRDWRRIKALAGLPAAAHPHTLRHTFASTLFALGRPLPEISYLLGHASIATTATVYAHFVNRAPEEAIASLSAYFRQRPPAPEAATGHRAPRLADARPTRRVLKATAEGTETTERGAPP